MSLDASPRLLKQTRSRLNLVVCLVPAALKVHAAQAIASSHIRQESHAPAVKIGDCVDSTALASVPLPLINPPRRSVLIHVLANNWLHIRAISLRWTGFSGQAPSLTSDAGYRP